MTNADAAPSPAFEEWASEEGINNFHFNHCWAAWQAALLSANKPQEWRCFHCDEAFTDAESAALHFGKSEYQNPICSVDTAEYRAMEERVRRCNEEDSDLHREIHGLHAQHHIELQREEEKGYARGLRDQKAEALRWAVRRWKAEVSLRPIVNVHRRSLDDTWRQVVRYCDGDAATLLGPSHSDLLATSIAAPAQSREALTVWYGTMPESNGKTNYTAILHKGDVTRGITLDMSEYPDRVRYEADRMRWMIGELDKAPCTLDYDADKHSGYAPQPSQPVEAGETTEEQIRNAIHLARQYWQQQPTYTADDIVRRVLGSDPAVALDDERAAFDLKNFEGSVRLIVEQSRSWEKAYHDAAVLYEDLDSYKTSVESEMHHLINMYRAVLEAHASTLGQFRRFARAASPQTTETQLVGWFVQRSKFGPWVEVEQQEPGAVQFYRGPRLAKGESHE